MAYLAASTYEAIRNDPSMVVTYYNSTRSQFIADLGWSDLSEELLQAAWCSVVSYGMAPYGAGPNSLELDDLLKSDHLECASQVTLTFHLMDEFGISNENQVAMGWDSGAVGNHAQMIVSDGFSSLLLDPTIGLVVRDVTLEGLIEGTHYTAMKSFYHWGDIDAFNMNVKEAIALGEYEVRDAIYSVPGIDNWLNAYAEHQGLMLEHGNDSQTIVGSLYNDVIVAGLGNDIVYGGKGADNLDLGDGIDFGYGGFGNDFLYGGHGDDTIFGEGGKDLMTGAGGLDQFRFTDLSESGITFAQRDVINTFAHGDKINLASIDANSLVGGNQAFTFGSAFTGVAGQLQWDLTNVSSTGVKGYLVQGDVNGDSHADFSLQIYTSPTASLAGGPANWNLAAWDFVL
jgi:Ca2+-binding RTX toxin-like protein